MLQVLIIAISYILINNSYYGYNIFTTSKIYQSNRYSIKPISQMSELINNNENLISIPQETISLYLDNTYLFEETAMITDIYELQDCKYGNICICLNQTIFHPQGGGQPSDIGHISLLHFTSEKNNVNDNDVTINDPSFNVKFVRKSLINDKIIEHIGNFNTNNQIDSLQQLFINKPITMQINSELRLIHSRLHSAGHIIDVAMDKIGYSSVLTPTKGYHFQDGMNWYHILILLLLLYSKLYYH